ncbi:Hypothetical protein D9617_1g084160 [Elsinoe fawcettii]|nr:Hypothetical protein D9617_1g084160 [Elsinoe fawcettii]
MKFTTPLLAAAMLASSVQACIRLHVVTAYNPTQGDGMRVQIWDNNDFYDVQSQNHDGANGDTHWQFAFGNGHYVELWDNGKAGFVSLPGGYSANLTPRMRQCEKNCYLFGENYCKLSGLLYETSLDDGFGNCGDYGQQLCNFADCNGWHEQGWSNGDDGICRPNY